MSLEISNFACHRKGFLLQVPHLKVDEGSITCVVGHSGCGKSSLLLAIAGFLSLEHGEITVSKQNLASLPPERRRVGLLFQRPALFSNLNVTKNIEFGLRVQGIAKSDRHQITSKWLARLRIEELANRFPHELSGGQAQRVALGRALAVGFPVLLLDEPLSALDPPLRRELRMLITSLVKQANVCCLWVSHDPLDINVATRIMVLEQGRVAYLGEKETAVEKSPWLKAFLM